MINRQVKEPNCEDEMGDPEAVTASGPALPEHAPWLGANAGASRPVPPCLTRRELEVLRWTAEGKTAFEISVIVGLSERTVNFHIHRVLAKLEATNKTQAAVKAAVMGLLF
jgi:DNA-binding CsgD family transcriptional regulator